ncbi:MAG: nitrophenyl compound nitroreductase subunit ArsF family protein, partial [Planctomycetota bacterium]
MKTQKIVTIVLLLFVGVSLAFLIAKEVNRPPADTKQKADPAVQEPAPVKQISEETKKASDEPNQAPVTLAAEPEILVYYFYTNYRCVTCKKFEAYTNELLKGTFAQQLNDGRVKWLPVNVDEPQNSHFIKDYGLVTKSIVIVKQLEGGQARWKNLDQIWQLVSDKQKFTNYVAEEIKSFIGE